MGIKDLWSILIPFCERKPLYELQGKTVAIDLSCWICEAQNVSEYMVQPRMYLRNLYFRTCYLLLMEVNPVFVLEGKAPKLKYDTITARNAVQFKGSRPKTEGVKAGKDRSRFHFTLKQCEEMLRYMGLTCIKGNGEAEALCAYLNEDGLVDGCISQDSDCFAYGARIVYRNFSISQQGSHSATGGAVDIYDIQKAADNLGFGRNKIVALALLAGCDYSEGVHGVGKDSTLKLFTRYSDAEILDRLRSWRKSVSLYNEFEKKVSDKNICTSCGHLGKVQGHNKNGCGACKTTKGCDFSKFRDERLDIKNELSIRSKAIADSGFPDEALIDEFLTRKDNVSELDLSWKQPDMINFVKFTSKYLGWEEVYAFEKLLPILTRWQLHNFGRVDKKNESGSPKVKGLLYPHCIKKIRNPKGIRSYEIIWADRENFFKGLIPENQISQIDLEALYSTIEPQLLVEKSYPDLVEAYQQSKIKPKKPSKRKQKLKSTVDELGSLLANTSIAEPEPKKRARKRTTKKKNTAENLQLENGGGRGKSNVKPIDSYFKQAIANSTKRRIAPESTRTLKSLDNSFNMDLSCFGDESDLDVSDIVEDIINRKPVPLSQIGINCITEEHKREDEKSLDNECSFFITNAVENDMFEQSFCKQQSYNSDEDTEEYDVENVVRSYPSLDVAHAEKAKLKSVQTKSDSDDDSFCVDYVPLIDRLRNKM